jgi:hypothetical protein
MITIDDELYGERTEFATIAEAQQAIRDCGPEFSATVLYAVGERIYNQGGQQVGSMSPAKPPAA